MASGIIIIRARDFAKQLTTFRSSAARARRAGSARSPSSGVIFVQQLAEAYLRRGTRSVSPRKAKRLAAAEAARSEAQRPHARARHPRRRRGDHRLRRGDRARVAARHAAAQPPDHLRGGSPRQADRSRDDAARGLRRQPHARERAVQHARLVHRRVRHHARRSRGRSASTAASARSRTSRSATATSTTSCRAASSPWPRAASRSAPRAKSSTSTSPSRSASASRSCSTSPRCCSSSTTSTGPRRACSASRSRSRRSRCCPRSRT